MTATPVPNECPLCREPVPADAPSGACPRCLLGAGVPTGGRAAEAAGLGAGDVAAKFPDYEILGFLGRGGMGVVWKVRNRALDRVVALKVLPPDVARAPGFAERFQREARALARLAHPNIVGVHEAGHRDGTFFLVMEYVDGVNMRHALREGRIGARDVLRIVPQICDALQYAHDHGVVHRDIKPENVLIATDGRVKVADFGLAKIVGGDTAVDLTLDGQVMGTPAYMAPEQVERPTSVDHRADIYSLGVVFYEMLTGELPLGRFDAPSKRVQVDVRFDEVVLRSLEKAPERRWQRADDVKDEVGVIAAGPVAASPTLPPSIWGLSDRTRLLALRALIVTSAAASLFAIAVAVRGGSVSRLVFAMLFAAVCVLAVRRHRAWAPVVSRAAAPAARAAAVAPPPVASPRTNRLAVVSFVLALVALGLVAMPTVLRANTGSGSFLVFTLGIGLLLSALVGGIVSWVQIVRSKGGERGLGYAIAATILAVVLPCLAGPLVFVLLPLESAGPSRPTAPYPPATIDRTEDGVELPSSGERPESVGTADAREIRTEILALLASLRDVHGQLKPAEAGQFYASADWQAVVNGWERTDEWNAWRGAKGLPLTGEAWLDGPLSSFRVAGLQVGADPGAATLVLESDWKRVRARLRRVDSGWRFTTEPVVLEGK